MTEVNLSRPIMVQKDDGTTTILPGGKQDIEDDLADHWYVRAHFMDAPDPVLTPGTQEYAAKKRKEASAMKEAADKALAEADEAEENTRAQRDADEVTATNRRVAKDARVAFAKASKGDDDDDNPSTSRNKLKQR